MSRHVPTLFLLASLGLGVGFASGGEYSDPSGFAFTYPDGWVVAASAQSTPVKDVLPPEIKDWLAKNQVDVTKVNVLLVRDGEDEFLENVNVVVNNREMPINDNSVRELLKLLPAQFAKLNAKVGSIDGKLEKLGANDAIVVDYQVTLPETDSPVKQRQVYLAGGGKTFIATCTATPASFSTYAPTFETILASFRVPASKSQLFDVESARIGMVAGAIGGAIGGLIVALRKKKGAKKPRTEV